MSKKKTASQTVGVKKKGAPVIYTREVILRFLKFMLGTNRPSVLFQHKNYNKVKSAKQRQGVTFKHVPLLVAMKREALNVTDIFTKAGELKEDIEKEMAKLPRIR